MYLEDFYDYKTQLMKDLLTEPNIVKLLHDDPLEELGDPKDLVYKQVFPYEFIPDTVEHGRTFICTDVDVEYINDRNNPRGSKTFIDAKLYIWVFTHVSLMRLPEGGVRVDKLCSEICKKIDRSRMYGLGELMLASSKRFAIMTDYNGKVLTFRAREFNAPSGVGPPRPMPSNRKRFPADASVATS